MFYVWSAPCRLRRGTTRLRRVSGQIKKSFLAGKPHLRLPTWLAIFRRSAYGTAGRPEFWARKSIIRHRGGVRLGAFLGAALGGSARRQRHGLIRLSMGLIGPAGRSSQPRPWGSLSSLARIAARAVALPPRTGAWFVPRRASVRRASGGPRRIVSHLLAGLVHLPAPQRPQRAGRRRPHPGLSGPFNRTQATGLRLAGTRPVPQLHAELRGGHPRPRHGPPARGEGPAADVGRGRGRA